jgi:hypothetical protein
MLLRRIPLGARALPLPALAQSPERRARRSAAGAAVTEGSDRFSLANDLARWRGVAQAANTCVE